MTRQLLAKNKHMFQLCADHYKIYKIKINKNIYVTAGCHHRAVQHGGHHSELDETNLTNLDTLNKNYDTLKSWWEISLLVRLNF